MVWKGKGITFLENFDWRGEREGQLMQDQSDAAAASWIQERGRHTTQGASDGFWLRIKVEGLISEECLTTDENSCKRKQMVSQRQGIWWLGVTGRLVQAAVLFQGTDGCQEGSQQGTARAGEFLLQISALFFFHPN